MEIIFNKLFYHINYKSSSAKVCFDDMNLIIHRGELVKILSLDDLNFIGELLLVIKRPSRGEIKIDNMIIKRSSHIDNINLLRKRIGFVSDNFTFYEKIVKNEIKTIMKNYNCKVKNLSKHISDSLKLVGLNDEYLERYIDTLSYSEKKKVKLACVMSYNPEVLILNNFEKGLNYCDQEYFKKLFNKLKNKFKKTIILLGDSVYFSSDVVDKVYVINKGKLVVSGDKNVIFEDKIYNYLEMPKIIEFIKYAQSEGHNILNYTDIKELIKELYRNVK